MNYRESTPVEIWSAQIACRLPQNQLARIFSQGARSPDGYVDGHYQVVDERVNLVTVTRGVRIDEEPVPLDMSELLLANLVHYTWGELTRENFDKDLRIAMGLKEDAPGTSRSTHQIGEIQAMLPAAIILQAGKVVMQHGAASLNTDAIPAPAAVIYADEGMLERVYEVGAYLGQQQFTVENFAGGHMYSVEAYRQEQPDTSGRR